MSKHTTNQFTGDINTTITPLTEIIQKHLGLGGRMIGMSKSRYREHTPEGKPYFNACIFDKDLTQVWYGDVDLNIDKDKLEAIVKEAKEIFYVTPEHPFRSDFNKVTQEQLDKDEYVVKFGEKINARQ